MNILAKITPKVNNATKLVRPDCFADHHAPKSVIELFTKWVRKADLTDNSIIVINREKQVYGRTTTAKAIAWLVKHRLLVKVERGGGRGVGSRYFVRWSFAHETLSTRQTSVNHPETKISGHLDIYAREGALQASEERPNSKKHSSFKNETFPNVVLSASKKTVIKAKNKKQRQLRNERATRWALVKVREITTDADVMRASALAIRRVLASGEVFPGPELNRFVREVAASIEDIEELGWIDGPQATFSHVGFLAQEARESIRHGRQRWAERQVRALERAEARANPIGDFSCREYNRRNSGGNYEAETRTTTVASGKGIYPAVERRGMGSGPDSDRVESPQEASVLFSKSLEWREPRVCPGCRR